MSKLYDPFDSILGQILQREIQTKQLVNEHALLPINDYLQRYIFPHFKQKPIQSYLDIAAGTGILSSQITDILRRNGHPAQMFTLDLFNKVAEHDCHIQADGLQLPFRRHSFDFITMNFGFRYFASSPKNQAGNSDTSLFEETAKNHNLDKEPILYNQFMTKALFLHDILYRVLKPSGRLMLMLTTEAPNTPLNIWGSCLSMMSDCVHAESSLWAAIKRFWRIANPTSIAFINALYNKDVVAQHAENHYFNSQTVTQALLQHFQGQVVSTKVSTCISVLEFIAPNENINPQPLPIQEELDEKQPEYALFV